MLDAKNVYVIPFLSQLSQTSRLFMVPTGCRDPAQKVTVNAQPRGISGWENRSE